MYDAEEFRNLARHCMRQADRPGVSLAQKTKLLRMAASWIALANDAAHVNGLIVDAVKSESDNKR
jgi:hypothetical protein